MVHSDPRDGLEAAKRRMERYADEGKITDDDAARIKEIAEAYDDTNTVRSPPEGDSSRSPMTLTTWITQMSKVAREVPLDKLHADPDGERDTNINEVTTWFYTGDSEFVQNGGIKKKTTQKIQLTMRRFYHYHDGLAVDADDINYYTDIPDDDTVDSQDILTRGEILRARKSADHPRDEAMFTLMIYTGLRNSALRSLRWQDIDLDKSRYKLNPNSEALKGANDVGKWRTLLDAVQPLRDWKNYHPAPDNPDAYVFTKKPRWTSEENLDPETQISSNTVSYSMRQIKKKAEIDKPMHPHMLRHNFVTIAKEDYELPDATVKFLIGHEQDSDVMQRVYSHLSDESHNEKAEIAAGIKDPDKGEGNRLTPETCRTCGATVEPDAKACSRCGVVFTLDAHETKETVESQLWDDKGDVEAGSEVDKGIDALREIINENPGLIEELTD